MQYFILRKCINFDKIDYDSQFKLLMASARKRRLHAKKVEKGKALKLSLTNTRKDLRELLVTTKKVYTFEQ